MTHNMVLNKNKHEVTDKFSRTYCFRNSGSYYIVLYSGAVNL